MTMAHGFMTRRLQGGIVWTPLVGWAPM